MRYEVYCQGRVHGVRLTARGVRFDDCPDAYESLSRKRMMAVLSRGWISDSNLTGCEQVALWTRARTVPGGDFCPPWKQIMVWLAAVREERRLRDWNREVEKIGHDH
jgi:hypothetical protein